MRSVQIDAKLQDTALILAVVQTSTTTLTYDRKIFV